MPKFTKILSVVTLTGVAALLATGIADAQPRRGGRGGGRVIVARPFYNPWFYNGWYGSPFMGGWWGYPIGYPYPPFGYGAYYRGADVRLQVEPRQTEVFVDGYYAGIVDDFDGVFQRLTLEVGPHEIMIERPGFEPQVYNIYVDPTRTVDVRADLYPDRY